MAVRPSERMKNGLTKTSISEATKNRHTVGRNMRSKTLYNAV